MRRICCWVLIIAQICFLTMLWKSQITDGSGIIATASNLRGKVYFCLDGRRVEVYIFNSV